MKDVEILKDRTESELVILTIGYEGTNIEQFLERLIKAEVEVLVDVRELPLSRKKGFSKNKLKEAVENIGIEYRHMRDLGDPKEGRMAARQGNTARFIEIFSNHMETDSAQEALNDLCELVSEKRSCLLCFERCHSTCHRSIVASHVVDRLSSTVSHLSV